MIPSPNESARSSPSTVHRPLFLIGYRGVGKTTVARILASRLGWSWIDADGALEARGGQTIGEIFAGQGESAFREIESEVFRELCALKNHVIATGGGVVLRPVNRERMRSAGTAVWLTADSETLWQRLQADTAAALSRPALRMGGKEEIDSLLRERAPLYSECADFVMDTAGRAPEDVANAIMSYLSSVSPST